MFKETVAKAGGTLLSVASIIAPVVALFLLSGTQFFLVVLVSFLISGVVYLLAGLLSHNSVFKAMASFVALIASVPVLRPLLVNWTFNDVLSVAVAFVAGRTWMVAALAVSATIAVVVSVVDWQKNFSANAGERLLTAGVSFAVPMLLISLANLIRYLTGGWMETGIVAGGLAVVITGGFFVSKAYRRWSYYHRYSPRRVTLSEEKYVREMPLSEEEYVREMRRRGEEFDADYYPTSVRKAKSVYYRRTSPLLKVAAVRVVVLVALGVPTALTLGGDSYIYLSAAVTFYALLEFSVIRSHNRDVERAARGDEIVRPAP